MMIMVQSRDNNFCKFHRFHFIAADHVKITPSNLYIVPNDDSGDSTFDCDSSKEFHWIVNGSTVSKDDIKYHSEVQVIQKHILWVKHCINNTQYGCGYNTTSGFFNATGTVYCKGVYIYFLCVKLYLYCIVGIYMLHAFLCNADAPQKVPDVHINFADENSANLSWGEPFNNFDPITNYTVTCSTGDGDASCTGCNIAGNTTRYCVIPKLLQTKSYTFHVKARNNIGIGEPGVIRHVAGTAVYLNTQQQKICMLVYFHYGLHTNNKTIVLIKPIVLLC